MTSKFSNYLSFIEYNLFDSNKLNIHSNKASDDNFISLTGKYEYDCKNKDTLMIKTSFNKLIKHKFMYNINKNNSLQFRIHTALLEKETLDMLTDFDFKLESFMKENYPDYTCKGKIVYSNIINMKVNKHKIYELYNKIINYNKYKSKYPNAKEIEVEEFDFSDNFILQVLNRIITDQKEFRLLISPLGWININTKTYGSYLGLVTLELKYKNSQISSSLDKKEIIVHEIINLVI